MPPSEVEPPKGLLDFHQGHASLVAGGFTFSDGSPVILRHEGKDIIRVYPKSDDEPAGLDATFFNEMGVEAFKIDRNVWIGPTDGWDFEVSGTRLTVWRSTGHVNMRLRLEPPGRVVVEHLDMRVKSHHILASEKRYALGKYKKNGDLFWSYVQAVPSSISDRTAIFEIEKPYKLRKRYDNLPPDRQFFDELNGWVISEHFGVSYIPSGMVVCSGCGFNLYSLANGEHPLETMRAAVFDQSSELSHFISSGLNPRWHDISIQAEGMPESLPAIGEGVGLMLDLSAMLHPDLPWPR